MIGKVGLPGRFSASVIDGWRIADLCGGRSQLARAAFSGPHRLNQGVSSSAHVLGDTSSNSGDMVTTKSEKLNGAQRSTVERADEIGRSGSIAFGWFFALAMVLTPVAFLTMLSQLTETPDPSSGASDGQVSALFLSIPVSFTIGVIWWIVAETRAKRMRKSLPR